MSNDTTDAKTDKSLDEHDVDAQPSGPPEFSKIIDINKASANGREYQLTPTKDDCDKIAARLGVNGVENFSGALTVQTSKHQIKVQGSLRAQLLRECVASLEPMTENIEEAIDIEFLRRAPIVVEGAEEDEPFWEQPEVHESDELDIGELLVQQLSLAMAPFPRKEGAASLAEEYGQIGSASPFAGLRESLKKEQKKQ